MTEHYENKKPEMPQASDYSLPKVSLEIGESLLADAQEQGMGAVMKQANERLMANNPGLYDAVGQFAVGLGLHSQEAIQVAHSVMVMTHELLRRQAESDTLDEMILPQEQGPLK